MAELLEYKYQGLEELLKKVDGNKLFAKPVKNWFEKTLLKIEQNVKAITPVDTGRLRSEIHKSSSGGQMPTEGKVFTNVEYAIPVELGSRPHMIFPKNKPFLAWQAGGKLGRETKRAGRTQMIGGGEWIFTKKGVHHPGAKGQFMFRKGLENSQDDLARYMKDAIAEIERIWSTK